VERDQRAESAGQRESGDGIARPQGRVAARAYARGVGGLHDGRAINQQEPGWEDTLTGLPKELFEFWKQYLRPKGYKIKFQVADWSGGKPGDIGISLNWSPK